MNIESDNEEPRAIVLAETLRLESNLLGVPLCVLNTRAAMNSSTLSHSWESGGIRSFFEFKRPDDCPFPQLVHADLMMTTIAMFAQAPNDDGRLVFRVQDIARNAGYTPAGDTSYQVIKEMVRRFSQCMVHWHQSWFAPNNEEKFRTWHGPLIIVEDILELREPDGRIALRRNPGNSQQEAMWHTLRLHPMVVESLRSQHVRVFFTRALQADMSDSAKCVYRYFFKFSDTSDIFRRYDHLMRALAWQSVRSKGKFKKWLKEQLDEIKSNGLISDFEEKQEGVTVRCIPIKTIRSVLKTRSVKSVDNELESLPILARSDEELLAEFPNIRSQGFLRDSVAEGIGAMIGLGQMDLAANKLRRQIAKTLRPG